MSDDVNAWNRTIIEEFRANNGSVGGMFEGATLVLLHTTGAKSGKERTNPLVALFEGGRIFVFASYAGAETSPDWYHNLVANPHVEVEFGTDQFSATARCSNVPSATRFMRNRRPRARPSRSIRPKRPV